MEITVRMMLGEIEDHDKPYQLKIILLIRELTETMAGERHIKHCLKNSLYGIIEHVHIVFLCGIFLMQQCSKHVLTDLGYF